MKAPSKPAKSVQRDKLVERQQLSFDFSEATEPIVKPDRAVEQGARHNIEPDPLQTIGYRQMLGA